MSRNAFAQIERDYSRDEEMREIAREERERDDKYAHEAMQSMVEKINYEYAKDKA